MHGANITRETPQARDAPRYFRRRAVGGVDARDQRESQAWLVERRRSSPAERAAWDRAFRDQE